MDQIPTAPEADIARVLEALHMEIDGVSAVLTILACDYTHSKPSEETIRNAIYFLTDRLSDQSKRVETLASTEMARRRRNG